MYHAVKLKNIVMTFENTIYLLWIALYALHSSSPNLSAVVTTPSGDFFSFTCVVCMWNTDSSVKVSLKQFPKHPATSKPPCCLRYIAWKVNKLYMIIKGLLLISKNITPQKRTYIEKICDIVLSTFFLLFSRIILTTSSNSSSEHWLNAKMSASVLNGITSGLSTWRCILTSVLRYFLIVLKKFFEDWTDALTSHKRTILWKITYSLSSFCVVWLWMIISWSFLISVTKLSICSRRASTFSTVSLVLFTSL